MAFAYIPVPLFNEEHFSNCIVVPFPEGGKIVDRLVVDRTAYLLVEARPGAKNTTAHFHVVPAFAPLYADSHEYVGTFQIPNFHGSDLALLSVIRINEGDYGIFSAEFLAIHGEAERDKIIAAVEGELKPDPETLSNEDDLRKLWDFDIGGKDKTDDQNDEDTETEL